MTVSQALLRRGFLVAIRLRLVDDEPCPIRHVLTNGTTPDRAAKAHPAERRRRIMAIAVAVQKYLSDNGIEYDTVSHPPTQSSLGTAQSSHVKSDRIAKGVLRPRTTFDWASSGRG